MSATTKEGKRHRAPPDSDSDSLPGELEEELEFDRKASAGRKSPTPNKVPGWFARWLPKPAQQVLQKSPSELKAEAVFLVRRTLLDTSSDVKEDGGLKDLVSDLARAARSGELSRNVMQLSECLVDQYMPPVPDDDEQAVVPSNVQQQNPVRRVLRLARVFTHRLRVRSQRAVRAFWEHPPARVAAFNNMVKVRALPIRDRVSETKAKAQELAARVMQALDGVRESIKRGDAPGIVEGRVREASQILTAELERIKNSDTVAGAKSTVSVVIEAILKELEELRVGLTSGEGSLEERANKVVENVKARLFGNTQDGGVARDERKDGEESGEEDKAEVRTKTKAKEQPSKVKVHDKVHDKVQDRVHNKEQEKEHGKKVKAASAPPTSPRRVHETIVKTKEILAQKMQEVQQAHGSKQVKARLLAAIAESATEIDKIRLNVADVGDDLQTEVLSKCAQTLEKLMQLLLAFRASVDRGDEQLQEKFKMVMEKIQADLSRLDTTVP
jgi:hypothetical protein